MQLILLVCLSFHICVIMFLMFVLGSELEEACKKFQEEISRVRNLRFAITNTLKHLRLESDTLQCEEAALRAHEKCIGASFEHLKESSNGLILGPHQGHHSVILPGIP